LKAEASNNKLAIGLVIAAIVFFFFLFGFTGVRTIVGFIFLIFPIYLILNNFELDQFEKIIFSIFIGIGIFPSIAYWLGLWFSSLLISVVVTFILLTLIRLLLMKVYKNKKDLRN